MGHITLNGFSGSILGRPDVVKDKKGIKWAIFNTGEYLDPIHGRGKLATCVVPLNQVKRVGRNYISSTLVQLKPFRLLPSFVNNYLRYESQRFNSTKVYFGYVDEEFAHVNPDFDDLQDKIDALESRVNSQRKIIEGKNDELIEQIELNKKITGNENPIFGFLRRSPSADVPPQQ